MPVHESASALRTPAAVVDFGNGSDAAVATALWSLAGQEGLIESCSARNILSAFDLGFNVQFDPLERRFRQKLIFVLLDHLGCAFYDDYPVEKAEDLVSVPLTEARQLSFPVQIAVLDSLFAAYRGHGSCHKTVRVRGTHRDKALKRTAAICDEVCRIRDTLPPPHRGRCTLNLIGVSRLQAKNLMERGFAIRAFDHAADYVGETILPGVVVSGAQSPDEQVEGANIILVSGMTIANNTLVGILRASARRGIPSVCWAVTGSNLAPLFRVAGLTSAICEGFPPYFLPGETSLRIFRRA